MTEEKPIDEATLADDLPPEGPEEIMSESTLKRAAALGASGATRYNISKTLKISNYFAGKIMRDDRYKQLVEEIGNDAVLGAKTYLRTEMSRLSKKAIAALEKNLDKHNLNAALAVLRSLGVETAKDEGEKQQGFTLVLAGQKPEPTTVVVKREGDND